MTRRSDPERRAAGSRGAGSRGAVVGVLGGMGPQATWDFCRRLTAATPAERDQDHLRIRVDCDPSVPDRSAAGAGHGPSPAPRLAEMARDLVASGAEVLCMPCVTAHAYVDAVRDAAPEATFVDMVEASVAAVGRATPGATRVGLLATTATVRSELFQRAFGRSGTESVVPEADAQEEVMRLVYAVKGGDVGPDRRAQLARLAEDLAARGAEAIVLGCTELPLVGDDGPAGGARSVPWVACTEALATAVVSVATDSDALRPNP